MPLNLVTDHTSEAKSQMQVKIFFSIPGAGIHIYFNPVEISNKLSVTSPYSGKSWYSTNFVDEEKSEGDGKSEIYPSRMYCGCDLVSDCNAV